MNTESNQAGKQRADCKDWARRIVARHRAGERVNKTVLQMAQNALRIGVPRAA